MSAAREEIAAQARAYLDELREAASAAHERLNSALLRLGAPEPAMPFQGSEPAAEPPEEPLVSPSGDDPIFTTREFDMPPEAMHALGIEPEHS